MAEGFARALGGDGIAAESAGSKPSGKVNPLAIEVMKEKGIDISAQSSEGFDALQGKEFDYVVSMGCGDSCPFHPGAKRITWDIPNPAGGGIERFREIRDIIEERVRELIR